MDVTININFEQILNIIKRLLKNQLEKIKLELQSLGDKTEEENDRFKKLLLSGPVMSDKQYQDY